MSILSLHPNQQRILAALQSATRILRQRDSLRIVGSLGRFFAGQVDRVGDIDVLIDTPLCERYWDFLEILGLHGIRSVYDILDRPVFPWNPCRQGIAHAKALTIDCCANVLMATGMKHANLDICFFASDLPAIPNSSQWIRLVEPAKLPPVGDASRKRVIDADRQLFLEDLRAGEKTLSNRRLHDELGLYYAW